MRSAAEPRKAITIAFCNISHLASTILGEVVLDAGAVRVLKEAGKSLLAVGIVGVAGAFNRGEVIVCLDGEGREVARGLSNYSAAEVERLMGKSSERIVELLGYAGDDEIIHRDNLILSET